MRSNHVLPMLALACVVSPAIAEEPFVVVRDRVHLERGGRIVEAVGVRPGRGAPSSDGDIELVVERNRVRGRDRTTGRERFVVDLPPGRRLEVVASTKETALTRWWKRGFGDGATAPGPDGAAPGSGEEEGPVWVVDGADRLRRLSLQEGRWLEPFEVPGGRIRSVVTDGDGAVVVSDPAPGVYRLTSFRATGAQPLWSKAFRSAPRQRGRPEYVANLAVLTYEPDGTAHEIELGGTELIVCAGASQELLALDRASGETLWQIDRIWEYERFHDRPNLFGWSTRRATPRADRADLAGRCRIVAGPFVAGSGADRRVFVAVSRDREEGTGAPIPEGVTYEIEGGTVSSVTRLPQPVLTQGSAVVRDGVLWRCAHDALAFQVPSRQETGGFNGMDDTDRSGLLNWYREPRDPPKVDAWLTTAVRPAELAVATDAIYAAVGGPYVAREGEKAFRVQVRRLDLAAGTETYFTLVVPFTGDLPSWEKANHSDTREGGRLTRVAIQHAWGVTTGVLAVRGDRLAIQIGSQGSDPFLVEFPTEALR